MKKFESFPVIIERLSAQGAGIGFIQKTPVSPKIKVSVPGTVPGDQVIAQVGPKRKGSYMGKLVEVKEPSLQRVTPRCRHVSVCGGCSLQQMDYASQLALKESEVQALFSPLFKGDIAPIIGADPIWEYRNKMEYTFSQDQEGNRFLGLMKVQAKGRVEPISECFLSPQWFILLLEKVRLWWEESGLQAFHLYKNTGSLRTLTVREGRKTGDKMVILTVSGCPEYALHKEQLTSFVEYVHQAVEGDPSIFLRVQQAIEGKPTQFYEMLLAGPSHIAEELEICHFSYKKNYRFLISPTAFFQPNTLQAEKIYSQALELAGLEKKRLVFDLYAGTATLGMIFAPFAEKVIAIELNPYAVFDAEHNKELNGIDNLQIEKGDVAKVLRALYEKDPLLAKPDLVLIDPPRTGLLPDALAIIIDLEPKEIIYISCAPATQARDCKMLQESGYEIVCIQPIDQFPHTIHMENIVKLKANFH
jgi:23S rRNA (uracil1939-C5)-methyltransferase